MNTFKNLWIAAVLLLLLAGAAPAADTPEDKTKELEQKIEQLQKQVDALQAAGTTEAQLQEIRRQIEVLAAEIEKLRSGDETVEIDDATRAALGLGPSAATVYTKKQGVSFAGYGEMLYENFNERNDSGLLSARFDRIDLVRAVLYAGYRFNDRFLFNSEIEFEHVKTEDNVGEVSVEFAHIDFRATDEITLRGGNMLVPMGLINEFHEPNVYLGTRRPLTETLIIPSTWHENGFGILGRHGILDYRAYVINGFNAAGFDSTGVREGRQDGAEAHIDPAFVGRLDIRPVAGLMIGGSIYTGNSGYFATTFNPGDHYRTTIGEVHGEYRSGAWDVRALYAHSSIGDVDRLNVLVDSTPLTSISGAQEGGYVQAGYNVFSRKYKEAALIPYVRFEKINTQKDVAAGYLPNPALDFHVWTFGAQFLPIHNIVIKADYQDYSDSADSGVDQFNISLGYSF